MHKKVLALAVLAAAACLGTQAQADDLTGWFVNGGVGSAHYRASYAGSAGSDSDTSYQFNAGWRKQFIGIEGGYVDLGGVHYADDAGDSLKASGNGFTLGFNGHFNPTEKWYISARAGLFFWKVNATATENLGEGGIVTASDSTRGTNGYAGIGTGVDFNRNWSLGANFDYYQMAKQGAHLHAKVYTVNLEYRF